ncbi:MAG: hypothetical protein GXX09_11220, partial [Syntrophomonadaceae bacterium]|nr:hypothetical protein [Syntrophomonadaceae bacterium]
MSRIRLTLGRRWLLGLLCAVSLAVAIAGVLTTAPVYAANAPEIVLMQGGETSVPLDLPDDSYGELVVEGLPAGVIADLQPASPETEPILKITASPETNPGDRLFTITDSVYQTPVVTGLLKIRPGMIVDLMPMDVRDDGTVKHALILKHLDGQPLDIPLQAHLAATAPLQFSLDGQTFLSEGDITFNNGTCQLFLAGAGQLTLTSKEFGLGATLDIAGTIPTIEKTIISTESTVVDTENTTGSNIRTYDLANDWSTTNNPNEAWSYGYKTTKTSEFTLYDKTRFTLGDITLWYSLATVDNSPSTWKNTSSTSHYGVAPGEVTI